MNLKKILLAAVAVVLGAGLGGAAAFGTGKVLGGKPLIARAVPPPVFVSTGTILAPLVGTNGRLVGYTSFEVQLEVTGGRADAVRQRMPIMLNAVNMRTYRAPMASGPDGQVPGLDVFRQIVMDAANETYGPGVVSRAAVVQAAPV